MYQGEKNDFGERHGKGIFYYPNSFFVYEGDYVNGKKHGHGTLKFGDGGYYEGEFSENQIQGKGHRRYTDGTTYSGDFWMGERHGNGSLHKCNGDSFEGEWKVGKMDGKGESRVEKDGGSYTYKGMFKNHKPNGFGELKIRKNDGSSIIIQKGNFSNGFLSGSDCCSETTNLRDNSVSRYIGEFSSGVKNGRITCVHENNNNNNNNIILSKVLFEENEVMEFPSNIFCKIYEEPAEETSTPEEESSEIEETPTPEPSEDQKLIEFLYGEKEPLLTLKFGSDLILPPIICFLTSQLTKEETKEFQQRKNLENKSRRNSRRNSSRKGGKKKTSPKKKAGGSGRKKGKVVEKVEDPNFKILRRFNRESGRVIRCSLSKIGEDFSRKSARKKGKNLKTKEIEEDENKSWYELIFDHISEDDRNLKFWEKKLPLVDLEDNSVDQEIKFRLEDLPEDLSVGMYLLSFEDMNSEISWKEGVNLEPFQMIFQVKK